MKNAYSPAIARSFNAFARYVILATMWSVRNVNDFITINGHYMAAAIAFYTMLCLFPVSLVTLTVISLILGDQGTELAIIAFVDGLMRVFPVFADDTGRALVSNLSNSLNNFAGFTGPLAIIFTALGSTAVFSSIRKSVNLVWGITRPRSFLAEKLIDVAMSIGAVLLLFVSVAVTSLSANLDDILRFLFPDVDINVMAVQRLAGWSSWLIGLMVFWLIYWWLPATKVRFLHVLPTALIATVAFEVSKISFLAYLANIGAWLGGVYGAFAAVIVLLTFVYVSAIILLAGAMLSSKWVVFLNTWERKQLNEALYKNLQRVRSSKDIFGMQALAGERAMLPSAAERERRRAE